MKLYENVYAIPRDYRHVTQNDDRRKWLGLYEYDHEENTSQAIAEGNYYLYLKSIEDKYNYYWTGHGLRDVDKHRATPIKLSTEKSETPIFGGYLDSHMGHFFIEVLARGIDFNLYKNHPIVFLLLRGRANINVFLKYCTFFGLDKNQIIIIDKPVVIPRLYVPKPQFFITEERIKSVGNSQYAYINPDLSENHIPAKYFSDRFLETHRKKGDSITLDENTIDKILYLSCIKSKLYLGEKIIHRVLEERGHTVICPEEHSWETVIAMVRRHKHVVGLKGSAMHFLLFCRDKKRVTYFDGSDKLQHNFHNLEQMMNNDSDYVQIQLVGIAGRPETNNLFVYEGLVQLLTKLGVKNLSHHYQKIYDQIITQNHKTYWQTH